MRLRNRGAACLQLSQVKRNIVRFPEDFMSQFTTEEILGDFLKSQNATLNEKGNKRKIPHSPICAYFFGGIPTASTKDFRNPL